MKTDYTLYSWQLSYFSGKMRGYLNYKGANFVDKPINSYQLLYQIPKKTGATVMPVVKTSQGEWLQDTTDIIDRLEQNHRDNAVLADTPKQRIASLIFEAWADEWWIPIAMHYRWSYPENYTLFEEEGGKALLPYAPKFARNLAVQQAANRLRSYLPAVGVTPEQFGTMERWTNQMLDIFEDHFAQHAYLLGDKPSLGDFALLGPLYGHLNRDPAPKRNLLDPRPNLQAWVQRAHNGNQGQGSLLPDDEIPATLHPVFAAIFNEFFPMISAYAEVIAKFVAQQGLTSGDKLPRGLDMVSFPMGSQQFIRACVPYSVWMMQRAQEQYLQLKPMEQSTVDQWLAEFDQGPFAEFDLGPKLKRHALGTRLD